MWQKSNHMAWQLLSAYFQRWLIPYIWILGLCFQQKMSSLEKRVSIFMENFFYWMGGDGKCSDGESLYHFSFIASPWSGRDWEISVELNDSVHWIFIVIVDNKEEFLSWGNTRGCWKGYHLLLLHRSRQPSLAGVWKLLFRFNTVYAWYACLGLCMASSFIKMSVSFFIYIGSSTVIQTTIQSQKWSKRGPLRSTSQPYYS